MNDKVVRELLDVFYKNVEEAGKDHYRILYPEVLVASLFSKCLQLLGELVVVAVPDNAQGAQLSDMLTNEGAIEIGANSEE